LNSRSSFQFSASTAARLSVRAKPAGRLRLSVAVMLLIRHDPMWDGGIPKAVYGFSISMAVPDQERKSAGFFDY
jgi:hypothetical protein